MAADHDAEPETRPTVWRLGPDARLELDLAARELRRDGVAIDIQPKVLDLIACLVEHRDRVLDKDTLQDHVWPRQVVTEAALTRAVMKARRALDDDAERPRMIRTVHGRGYRWVAPVAPALATAVVPSPAGVAPESREAAAGAMAPAPATIVRDAGVAAKGDPSADGDASRAAPAMRRPWRFAASALLVLVAVALVVRYVAMPRPAATPPGQVRLAVLPVENRSGDPKLDWIELGLLGTLVQALREGQDLEVLPTAAALALGDAASVDQAAEALTRLADEHGATHVLAVRVERAAGTLHFHLLLRDTAGTERRRLFAGADPLALARAAVQEVFAAIGPSGIARERRAREALARDPLALEAYVRGLSFTLQGRNREALPFLRTAHETEPDAFWPAHEYAVTLRNLDRLDEAAPIFDRLVASRVRLGDPIGEKAARTGRGNLHRRLGRYEAARADLERALALSRELGDDTAVQLQLNALSQVDLAQERCTAADVRIAEAEANNAARFGGRADFFLLESRARIALCLGDLEGARLALEAARAHAERVGNVLWLGVSELYLGLVAYAAGDHRAALTHALRGAEGGASSGFASNRINALALAAMASARLGAGEDAGTHLRAAEELAAGRPPAPDLLRLDVARAVLAFERAAYAEAATAFLQAADRHAAFDQRRAAARLAVEALAAAYASREPSRIADARAALAVLPAEGSAGDLALRRLVAAIAGLAPDSRADALPAVEAPADAARLAWMVRAFAAEASPVAAHRHALLPVADPPPGTPRAALRAGADVAAALGRDGEARRWRAAAESSPGEVEARAALSPGA